MPTKDQLIEEIQVYNQSVSHDWLNLFDSTALRNYLDHLQLMLEPRGRTSVWVRRGDTAAIVTRLPA